jgi:hypothetical protein
MQHTDEVLRKLDVIEAALIGNPLSKDGGLVGEVKELKHEVAELKQFKDKSKWTASLLIGFAGVCGFVADKLIDLFKTH